MYEIFDYEYESLMNRRFTTKDENDASHSASVDYDED